MDSTDFNTEDAHQVDRLVPKTIASSSPKAQISGGETAALVSLRFARQRLADEVPNKATNDDVLA